MNKMAMADMVVPVMAYEEMHMLCGHYSNQLSRFACRRKLGRLCCRRDYQPFHQSMQFQPCDELADLEQESRLCTSFIPDAKKKADGHYEN